MGSNILVYNLTRFGDLIQSQQAIDDLHTAGHRVGLLCLENFADAAPLLRNVDVIHTLPAARLLAQMDRNWNSAAGNLLTFAASIKQDFQPDQIVNLTPTLPARFLTRLLARPESSTLGYGVDESGYVANSGVWATFLWVASRNRTNSPFNISTLMRKIALPASHNHNGSFRLSSPSAADMAWADEFLARESSAFPKMPKAFMAFQPGASENRRRWPVSHFRELGQKLYMEENICPVLLGSASEVHLAEKYAVGASHPFINAMGVTDIPKLAALLLKCGLLVTNDTGTMHLASGLGVPSLSFFLATAQPWDTGPLLSGCCCLEPDIDCHPCSFGNQCEGDKCRRAISPDIALSLVLAWLKTGAWENGLKDANANGCRVWITGEDQNGLANVRRIDRHESDWRSTWLKLMRDYWSHIFDEMENPDKVASWSSANASIECSTIKNATDLEQTSASLLQAADILDTLVACGKLARRGSRGGKLFLLNCRRLETVLGGSPHLAVMADFWREFSLNHNGGLNSLLPALPILAKNTRHLANLLHV